MTERIVHTCANGLRIVAEQSDGNVAYIGLLVNAGSRDDGRGKDGLAHFVEHTIFKGTPRRRGWQVSNRMELIGGELNAYTTKEEIMVYTNAPAGYEARALELIADLVENACFPPAEIDRERGVILEEIQSYRDNASYAVFDEFDELFYAGSDLAHNILGYADTVNALTQTDAVEFLRRHFNPHDMVMYCVSPTDPQRNLRLAEKYLGHILRPEATLIRPVPQVCGVFDETRDCDNHQANTVLGARIFPAYDPRRYALFLMSGLLGGPSMNSRLNRELRERRGLVYTVESSVSLYSNAGTFQIYFGTEPKDVEKCSRIVRREIDRLASETMSERMFTQARRQLCGQLLVSGDNRESCAMSLAKSLMRHGEIHDNRHTAERIMELSADDVRDVAEIIASQTFSRLTLI